MTSPMGFEGPYTFGPDGEEVAFKPTDKELEAFDRLGNHNGSYTSQVVVLGGRQGLDSQWKPNYDRSANNARLQDTTYLGGSLYQTNVIIYGLGASGTRSAEVTYFPNAEARNKFSEQLGAKPGTDSLKFVDCTGVCFDEKSPQVSRQGYILSPHFDTHIERLEVPFTTHQGQAAHDRDLNAHGLVWDTFRRKALEITVEEATARNKAYRRLPTRSRRQRLGTFVDALEQSSSLYLAGAEVRKQLLDHPEPVKEHFITDLTGISHLAHVIGPRSEQQEQALSEQLYAERVETATAMRAAAAKLQADS